MKRFLLTLSLALALPVAALAQQGPPPPGPGGPGWHSPSPAQRQQMRADFEQMRKLHEQFRANVLGALTPQHRQLLASVVGNLAVSDKPDRKAAVQQLDAALSPGEKTAILNAAASFRDQVKAQFEKMRAQHPWPRPSGAPHKGMVMHRTHAKHAPDAGAILLMTATGGDRIMIARGHGGRGMMMMMGHPR